MFKFINRKLTKNYKEIPLFWVNFNLNKYKKDGAENSCVVKIHPELKNDIWVECALYDLVDYIRKHYDMQILSK